MIKTTIEHYGKHFSIEQGENFVDVEIEGETAYIVYYVGGDEYAETDSCHSVDAMTTALNLIGIL